MVELTLAPGSLIVLEGLDKTGKSTQSDALRGIFDATTTSHVHMPSGVTAFAKDTYDLLESAERSPANGVAKQLAHLACHAETIPHLQHLLTTGSVVLDRWWWSTFAYGWFTGDIPAVGITEAAFRNLVDSIWSPVTASVVFLFDKPYQTDPNNADPVLDGYRQLAASFANTVHVPQGEPAEITRLLLSELHRRELIVS
ncbi:hypothetical protein [Cellulosimicrobium funkei]|uniref:hypothetical protein n=1 Tax=Cellulosimicrobium funkei TaxID=264251 RepID=UPI003D731161